MSKVAELRKRRADKRGALTRLMKNAETIMSVNGSRTQLLNLLTEANTILTALIDVNSDYVTECGDDEREVAAAMEYEEHETSRFDKFNETVREHLSARTGEAASMVSVDDRASIISKASVRSAEIAVRVLEAQSENLKKKLELKKEKEKIEEKIEIQNLEDAMSVAKLKVDMLREEDPLARERSGDFEESAAGNQRRFLNVTFPHNLDDHVTSNGYNVSDTHTNPVSNFSQSLPRLYLPVFNGNSSEWPKWLALFKILVHNQPLTNEEKMVRLQSSVSGGAERLIGGMLFDGALYEAALEALTNRFGRESDVVHCTLKTIFGCPPPRYMDVRSVEEFYNAVHNGVATLEQMNYTGDLRSLENLSRLVEKLPLEMRRSWAESTLNVVKPTLKDFSSWLETQLQVTLAAQGSGGTTSAASGLASFRAISTPQQYSSRSRYNMRDMPSGVHSAGEAGRRAFTTAAVSTLRFCICCKGSHELSLCSKFKEMNVPIRRQFIIQQKCCFSCLKRGHRAPHCWNSRRCGIGGCAQIHHKMLHPTDSDQTASDTRRPTTGAQCGENRVVATLADNVRESQVLLQVVPVRILGSNDRYCDTLALLDSGAETSLCSDRIADKLQLHNMIQPIRIRPAI